ncbi:MAG: hypothetical protein M3277_11985 [Actinomycetota bacterium]|nr:hypothetical protein [Actinomycetota bacterium]
MANRLAEPSPLRSHRRNRVLVVAAAVLAVGAFAAGRWTAPSGSPAVQEDPITRPPASPAPGAGSDGTTYPRTEAGAIDAATDYVRVLTPAPGETRDSFARGVQAIASDEWGDEMDSTIASWDDGTAEGAVLRYRVDSFSRDRAEVVLWVVGLVDSHDAPPEEIWARAFMTLVWEDDTWKVAAEDGDAGPKPATRQQPSSPADLRRVLDSFEVLDHEPDTTP